MASKLSAREQHPTPHSPTFPQSPKCRTTATTRAGIMREAAHFHFDDSWFGQQAVYRVSFGNFVSRVLQSHAPACSAALGRGGIL